MYFNYILVFFLFLFSNCQVNNENEITYSTEENYNFIIPLCSAPIVSPTGEDPSNTDENPSNTDENTSNLDNNENNGDEDNGSNETTDETILPTTPLTELIQIDIINELKNKYKDLNVEVTDGEDNYILNITFTDNEEVTEETLLEELSVVLQKYELDKCKVCSKQITLEMKLEVPEDTNENDVKEIIIKALMKVLVNQGITYSKSDIKIIIKHQNKNLRFLSTTVAVEYVFTIKIGIPDDFDEENVNLLDSTINSIISKEGKIYEEFAEKLGENIIVKDIKKIVPPEDKDYTVLIVSIVVPVSVILIIIIAIVSYKCYKKYKKPFKVLNDQQVMKVLDPYH